MYATAESLGSANSFSSVSENYIKANHMEGTYATGMLYTGTDQSGITSNVAGYINSDENLIYIAGIFNGISSITGSDVNYAGISALGTNNGGAKTDYLVLPEGTVITIMVITETVVSVNLMVSHLLRIVLMRCVFPRVWLPPIRLIIVLISVKK